ncbi:MAG: YcxB family protein [Pirellulales bacterium]
MQVETSTVSLSFRYRESDYVRAVRAHHASPLRQRLDFLLAVVLAIVGAHFWRTADLHWVGVVCVVASACLAMMMVAACVVVPRWVFRSEPKFHDEYSLTFSSDGVHFRTAHIDSQLQWSLYSRALIDAHSYLLYYGSRQFTLIPKRVFQSTEKEQEFEQLVTQHVLRIVRRDR